MAARIDEIIDAVETRLNTVWAPVSPSAVNVDFEPEQKLDSISGKQIYIFPSAYSPTEMVTRSKDRNIYSIVLVFASRYTASDKPTKAWMREQTAWVEGIFDNLNDHRIGQILSGVLVVRGSVDLVYDVQILRENKVFFSVASLDFEEIS